MAIFFIFALASAGAWVGYVGWHIRALLPFLAGNRLLGLLFWLLWGGGVYFAARSGLALIPWLIYCGLFYFAWDLASFVSLRLLPAGSVVALRAAWLPLVLAALVTLYGVYNAKRTVVHEYALELRPNASQSLRVAFFSDTHVGSTIGLQELETLVARLNALEPDVILFGGDLFDEAATSTEREGTYALFGGLKAPLGVYAVLGNHDYDPTAISRELGKVGMRVLADETLPLGGLTLVGRQDAGMSGRGAGRLPLETLLKDTGVAPVLLLDHQPRDYALAAQQGIELILSGHTHNGQLFPGNLLVSFFNDQGYGLRHWGEATQAIVSSGVGCWGFSARVASRSELVLLELRY